MPLYWAVSTLVRRRQLKFFWVFASNWIKDNYIATVVVVVAVRADSAHTQTHMYTHTHAQQSLTLSATNENQSSIKSNWICALLWPRSRCKREREREGGGQSERGITIIICVKEAMIISKARNAWQMMPCGSFTTLSTNRSRGCKARDSGNSSTSEGREGKVYRAQGVRAVVTIITTSKWFSEMLFELFAGNDFYFRK